MASERQVRFIWTCDACKQVATVDDSGSGHPPKWRQIAQAPIAAMLGNMPAQHLCDDCSEMLALLLDHRLGDAGDMAQAWDDAAEATADWMSTNPGPSGIPADPPTNPYATTPAATPDEDAAP